MDDPRPDNKSTIKKFLQFDKFALILGFVVDSITLVSILLAVSLSGTVGLASFITPVLAFVIWLLAVYTYVAYLHHHWETNLVQGLEDKFSMFLVNDLLLRFRKPLLLFPAVVSVITLLWIAASADKSGSLVITLGMACFLGFAFLLAHRMTYGSTTSDGELKHKIEDKWSHLKKRIKVELSRKQWVSPYDLSDFAEVWGVPLKAMAYALAKYAVEYPNQTKYGRVYRLEDDQPVSGLENVLVNLENFEYDKYYPV